MSAAYATALDFARHGYPVFPVRDKVPLVGAGGLHQASTDPEQLRAWHNLHPNAGWAVVCGNGFSVVDVDPRHGGDVQQVCDLVAGPMVETGQANGNGRGLHVYVEGDWPIGDTGLQGVEIRGTGAYVVIPGSPHPSGVTYRWVDAHRRPWTPDAMGPLPPALHPRRRERVVVDEGGRIPEGQRHDVLVHMAGHARRGGMSPGAIEAALRHEIENRCANPRTVDRDEAAKIARSSSTWEPGELPGVPTAGASDRLAPAIVDLVAELARPPVPTPWRVTDVVADGTVTVLSGEAGVGKSWFALALALAVADGRTVAGLDVFAGRALYVDAEMGTAMFVDRLRPLSVAATVAANGTLDYLDIAAAGLNLAKPADLAIVEQYIAAGGFRLVIMDSLRRLAPSAHENESDHMAPLVGGIAGVARRTGAAVVLVHHRGRDDHGFYRGSAAIRDQADALQALWEDEQGLRLRTRAGGKMRYAEMPEDVWLRLDPFSGGVRAALPGAPPPPASTTPRRDEIRADVLDVLPAKSMREVARKLDLRETDRTLTAAWRDLRDGGEIVQVRGVWQCSASLPSLGVPGDALHQEGAEIVDAEAVCERCGATLTVTPRGPVCIGCARWGADR